MSTSRGSACKKPCGEALVQTSGHTAWHAIRIQIQGGETTENQERKEHTKSCLYKRRAKQKERHKDKGGGEAKEEKKERLAIV